MPHVPARPPHPAADHPGRPRRRAGAVPRPGHGRPARRARAGVRRRACCGTRLGDGPVAALKLASRLRPALHVLRDPVLPRRVRLPAARRGAGRGRAGWPGRACASWSWSARTPRRTARTSATCGCSRRCCPSWPRSTGIDRVRVSYLQPAEMRPGLVEAIADRRPASRRTSTCPSSTPAAPVLRRMRRFGDTERFLELLEPGPRAARRRPGVRSNVIVGFPGETEDDVAELERFLDRGPARRDRRVRLLRRGRHRGGRRCDGKLDAGRGRAPGRAGHRAGRGAGAPSAPRSGSARPSRCSSRRSTGDGASRAAAAHQAPEVDGTHHAARRPAGVARRATSSRPRVVGSRRASTWSRAWRVTRDRRPATATPTPPAGQRLEHRQRADRAAAGAGPGLPRAAVPRRRRRRRLAGRSRSWRSRSPSVTDRVDGELARSAAWSPTSARSPTRSPTRR